MVFYFESNVVSPPIIFFMGKDKYENEDLIKWGWPEDVWFHVHNHSSAHVYLRLSKGQTLDNIPLEVLNDAAQLVKENSKEGKKLNNVEVDYTMWSNIKKTPDMEPGQVSFHCSKSVKQFHVEKRNTTILNRLRKTMTENYPDLRTQREFRDKLERDELKKKYILENLQQQEVIKKQEIESDLRCYKSLLKPEHMSSNCDDGNDSDDFM